MLSLFLQRAALRVPSTLVNTALRTRFAPSIAPSNRTWSRSFLTTPYVSFPAAAKTTATTKKKTTTAAKEKKTTATKIKAKAAPKKKAAKKPAAKTKAPAKKKAAKPKPVRFRITSDTRPPKYPPSPFSLFTSKFRAGQVRQEGESALDFGRRIVKGAAESWKAMTEQEKRPFYDEATQAKEQRHKERDEYFTKIDPSTLRKINKLRREQGKSTIRAPPHLRAKTTGSGWAIYYGEAVKKSEGLHVREVMKNAAAEWKGLSDQEKSVYVEKAKAKAKQAEAQN
ncbi:hypothetical protein K474DRAFT_1656878 [Panus rudis PR-1116 ss-1]|nr:hypothetical protein K474DRAFT_1656878 [Panus rudis PR-1116 ss-1]